MSPDLRYHVASLAAVFLALGIGILIGTAFVGSPLVARQTGLIKRLEGQVADLQRDTRAAERTEAALSQLVPGTVAGSLMGRSILLLQTGAFADAVDEARQALEAAGATVYRAELPLDAWRDQADDRAPEEAHRLAAALAAGDAAALEEFRTSGLLAGEGAPAAIRLVVLVGGSSASLATPADKPADLVVARRRDLPLAEALSALGVRVVGAEPTRADLSFIPVFREARLTTVDCVDRAAGRIALPAALTGEAGAFGLKSTSERALPERVGATPAPAAP